MRNRDFPPAGNLNTRQWQCLEVLNKVRSCVLTVCWFDFVKQILKGCVYSTWLQNDELKYFILYSVLQLYTLYKCQFAFKKAVDWTGGEDRYLLCLQCPVRSRLSGTTNRTRSLTYINTGHDLYLGRVRATVYPWVLLICRRTSQAFWQRPSCFLLLFALPLNRGGKSTLHFQSPPTKRK